MIVKNEENYLERCIKSALPLVDEVIVVDTGSTDKTIEIIKSFSKENVKLMEMEWEHNFSKARNLSIKNATGDWILILDADEILEYDKKALKEILQSEKEGVWNIPIINYLDLGAPVVSKAMIRLFPNTDIEYKREIHEQLYIDGKAPLGKSLDEETAKIHHFGYLEKNIKGQNKSQRNLKIIQEQIKKEPNVAFHQYNLGVAYMQVKKYKKALSAFLRWKDCSDNTTGGYEDLMHRVAECLLQLKYYDQLKSYLMDMEKNPDFSSSSLQMRWAEFYNEQKKYKKSKSHYYKALYFKLGEKEEKLISSVGDGSFTAIIRIALIYQKTNDYEKATHYFLNGVFSPENKNLLGINEMNVHLDGGIHKKYKEKIRKTIQHVQEENFEKYKGNLELEKTQEKIYMAIESSIELGDINKAGDILREYEKTVPFDPYTFSMKGIICMLKGNDFEAALYFLLSERFFPNAFDSVYNLACFYESIQLEDLAALYYIKAENHEKCPKEVNEDIKGKIGFYQHKLPWLKDL